MMLQAREHDISSIEECIRQAKEKRAQHIAEASRPTLKTIGGFALVAVMVPWHAVRNALTTLAS